tara:strand:+ start:4341 stop:4601 length:261 start_codon:yes stop_codon:yes gene_type:complete
MEELQDEVASSLEANFNQQIETNKEVSKRLLDYINANPQTDIFDLLFDASKALRMSNVSIDVANNGIKAFKNLSKLREELTNNINQ